MGMSSPGNGRNLIRPRIVQKQAASREAVDMGQHHSRDFGRGYLELWTFESSLFFLKQIAVRAGYDSTGVKWDKQSSV